MVIRKWFNYWISKDRSGFFTFLAVTLAIVYASGVVLRQIGQTGTASRLQLAAFAGFLLLAVFFFVHKNLHAYYDFLDLFRNTDHLPQKQISYVNSFCMTLFLICAVVGTVGLAFALEPLWRAIAEWFANRPVVTPEETQPETIPAPLPDMAPNLQELLGEGAPTPAWVNILSDLAEKLAIVLIIVAGLYLIRQIGRGIWGFITRPRRFDEDEKIYLKPALDMPLQPKSRTAGEKKESGVRYYLSYTARIRRHYRKRILESRRLKKQTGAPPEWASPLELEQAAGISDDSLHLLYEKARYSREECTEEDWRALSGGPSGNAS